MTGGTSGSVRARSGLNDRPSAEQISELVCRTRSEQGLPPTVTDPVALDQAASLLKPGLTERPTATPVGEEPGHAA